MSPTTVAAEATATLNRTAKRRLKTRQQLLDATQELILEKGLERISTDDITEAADLGRRTFYNHFDNKHDCVVAALKDRYRDFVLRAATAADRKLDAAQSLTNSAINVFNEMAKDPITQKLTDQPQLLAEAIAASQGEHLAEDYLNGLEQGTFKAVSSAEVISSITLWGFVGLLIDTIDQDRGEEQGTAWARFVLFNLGVEQSEIERLIENASKLSE